MSEVSKFVIAFVMGVVISIASYKYFGVPGFLGAPGAWSRTSTIAVSLEGPFAPAADDPSTYGPPMCAAVVRIENHSRHPVTLSYFLSRKTSRAANAPSRDPYAPPSGSGYDDNPRYDDGNDQPYGDPSSSDGSGGYGQDNQSQSDTPYADEIRPDEVARQTVKLQAGQYPDQDRYDGGANPASACDDLNRKGAVVWQLVGCTVENASNPADADCSRELRVGF